MESQALKPLTYRVEGIPPGTDEKELIRKFHTDDRQYIHVKSLVPDVDNYDGTGTLTATILFTGPRQPRPDDEDLVVDADFHGLTPLNIVQGEAAADIIAITGLAGHAFGSWAIKPEKMWLRDDLPKALNYRARVLIYGYKSQIHGENAGIGTLHDFGTKFWDTLMQMRKEPACMNRPLILIGHSLGGLIIKHCIVEEDPEVLSRHHLRAIFFFGTPHGGLNTDALRTVVKDEPSEDLIMELRRGSPTLVRLSTKFRKLMSAVKTKIFTYYESLETRTIVKNASGDGYVREGPAQLMVDPTSASLNFDREKCVQADGDHRTIAKLKNTQAGVFRSLVGHMKDCLQSGAELHDLKRQAGSLERTEPYAQEVHPNGSRGGQRPTSTTRVGSDHFVSPQSRPGFGPESDYVCGGHRVASPEELIQMSRRQQAIFDRHSANRWPGSSEDLSNFGSDIPMGPQIQRELSPRSEHTFDHGGHRRPSSEEISQISPRGQQAAFEKLPTRTWADSQHDFSPLIEDVHYTNRQRVPTESQPGYRHNRRESTQSSSDRGLVGSLRRVLTAPQNSASAQHGPPIRKMSISSTAYSERASENTENSTDWQFEGTLAGGIGDGCDICRSFISQDEIYYHCPNCKDDNGNTYDVCTPCEKKYQTCTKGHDLLKKRPAAKPVCNICRERIPDSEAYYYCPKCVHGSFHICEECEDENGRCPQDHHLLKKRPSAQKTPLTQASLLAAEIASMTTNLLSLGSTPNDEHENEATQRRSSCDSSQSGMDHAEDHAQVGDKQTAKRSSSEQSAIVDVASTHLQEDQKVEPTLSQSHLAPSAPPQPQDDLEADTEVTEPQIVQSTSSLPEDITEAKLTKSQEDVAFVAKVESHEAREEVSTASLSSDKATVNDADCDFAEAEVYGYFSCCVCGKTIAARKKRFLCTDVCTGLEGFLHKDCFLDGRHDIAHQCIAISNTYIMWSVPFAAFCAGQQVFRVQEHAHRNVRYDKEQKLWWMEFGSPSNFPRLYGTNFPSGTHIVWIKMRFEVHLGYDIGRLKIDHPNAALNFGVGRPHTKTKFVSDTVTETDPKRMSEALFASFGCAQCPLKPPRSDGERISSWAQWFTCPSDSKIQIDDKGMLGLVFSWSDMPQFAYNGTEVPILKGAVQAICYLTIEPGAAPIRCEEYRKQVKEQEKPNAISVGFARLFGRRAATTSTVAPAPGKSEPPKPSPEG